jgi:Tfp pilus assembly protein PilV
VIRPVFIGLPVVLVPVVILVMAVLAAVAVHRQPHQHQVVMG